METCNIYRLNSAYINDSIRLAESQISELEKNYYATMHKINIQWEM